MIYHTDFDKAHRCPRRSGTCDNGYVSAESTGGHFKRWHVYTCDKCGLKVARIPLLPHHPESGDTWRSRARWFFLRKLRWRWEDFWYMRSHR